MMIINQFASKVYNYLMFKIKKTFYPKTLTIHGKLRIYGTGNIHIGKNCTINSCESSNPIGGFNHSLFRTFKEGEIILGDRVGISNSALVSYSHIEIGDDTIIGGSCRIYDSDFHPLDADKRVSKQNEATVSKPIRIGKRVFIGANCAILKGVTIGDDAIIGLGSVVTKDVGDHEIWAGNPARFIRRTDT